MKGKVIIVIVLVSLMISGCSALSLSGQRRQEEITHQAQATEGNGKNEAKPEEPEEISTTDITDSEETKEYVLPETIWRITGMTAEEQAESFRAENPENYFFTDIKVNEENALVLTMNEKQKNMYAEEVISYLNSNIEVALEKDDIWIKINKDYSKIKMILGGESNSAGFQGTFAKVISYVAVYQILNGRNPEEWKVHLIVEKDEQIILDADIPDDKWVLTNEDFGE